MEGSMVYEQRELLAKIERLQESLMRLMEIWGIE